jgi:hypothetical protein
MPGSRESGTTKSKKVRRKSLTRILAAKMIRLGQRALAAEVQRFLREAIAAGSVVENE